MTFMFAVFMIVFKISDVLLKSWNYLLFKVNI